MLNKHLAAPTVMGIIRMISFSIRVKKDQGWSYLDTYLVLNDMITWDTEDSREFDLYP